MCYGCPVEERIRFLEEGTFELSAAGRDAVSSESRGRVFQQEVVGKSLEFWLLPGVCGWFEVRW